MLKLQIHKSHNSKLVDDLIRWQEEKRKKAEKEFNEWRNGLNKKILNRLGGPWQPGYYKKYPNRMY